MRASILTTRPPPPRTNKELSYLDSPAVDDQQRGPQQTPDQQRGRDRDNDDRSRREVVQRRRPENSSTVVVAALHVVKLIDVGQGLSAVFHDAESCDVIKAFARTTRVR